MNRIGSLSILFSIILFSSLAQAQLEIEVIKKRHDWTGFYAGGSLGGAWAHYSAPVILDPVRILTFTFGPYSVKHSGDASSLLGGAHIGYNYQDNHLILGAEASVTGQQLEASTVLTNFTNPFAADDRFVTRNTVQTAFLLRLGYAQDNWLFYGTGGVSLANLQYTADFVANVLNGISYPATFSRRTNTLIGGSAGIGAEYAWSKNWHFGLEARYTHYTVNDVDLGTVAAFSTGPTTFVFARAHSPVHTGIAIGILKVNYQFNSGVW